MILQKETVDKFGYTPDSLTNASKKKIILSCDYCGDICEKTKQATNIGRKYVKKDACIKCKFKKREDISLARDGVKNSAQRKEVRDKIRDTNIDRLQSDEYKELIKQTNLDKYGVEFAMQSPEVIKKHKQAFVDKFGVDNPSKVKEIKDRATKSMVETRISTGSYHSYEGKTRPELAKEQGFSRSHFGKLVNKHGFEKAVSMTPNESSLEVRFEEWLKTTDLNYSKQFRVGGKIADFKIDNVLIEVDGLYWHSEINIKDNNYHAEKRQIYIDNGYTPLFFRENEILNNFEVIKSMVLNKLKKSPTVLYARKCQIGTTTKEFFTKNHLMGKGYGQIFSLDYMGETVSAIQIRRLRDKQYEISRFCTKLNTNVIGGFSRLLKHVERTIEMDSLKTFIDLRYGKGDYLDSMGFSRKKPHLSFKWTNGTDSIHRLKFRGNSGYDLNFYKIWDCGQLAFVKEYKNKI